MINLNNISKLLSSKQQEDILSATEYVYDISGTKYLIFDGATTKLCLSHAYNFIFDKLTGDFKRWGTSFEDDPGFGPVGPELLDLEISVNGCPNACPFCYKNNKNVPATNMSLDTFKSILDKFPKSLTQVAFGITGVQTNPDFIPMMKYCREVGVIPNFTLSGIDLTDDLAEQCSKLVGALAVSAYQQDKNICYNTVKKFVDLGLKQTNIHLMVSEQTLDFVYEVLNDRQVDARLADMNAIIFLGVKPKGRAKDKYTPLSTEKFRKLIEYSFDKKLAIGFDSCSAPKFESAIKSMKLNPLQEKMLLSCSESCDKPDPSTIKFSPLLTERVFQKLAPGISFNPGPIIST